MKEGYIALIDSGVGGISLLLELLKILPNEKYLYFGDNYNAPYGNMNKRQLLDLTIKNIDFIKQYNVKVLAVACNTLSTNFLQQIGDYSGIKTFGVFPPIEKAITTGGNVLLLATNLTCEKYKEYRGVDVVGLGGLAQKIETNLFSIDTLSDVDIFEKTRKINQNVGHYKTVVLGCTHYFFVKNKIFDHLKPQKILRGETFTALKIKKYLETTKSLGKHYENNVFFVGENKILNEKFYAFCGQCGKNFIEKK